MRSLGWLIALSLVGCHLESSARLDAAIDAEVDAAIDGPSQDARPSCESADVVRQRALDAAGGGPHEVYLEESCPLQRIAADRVWEPTVECRQFDECGCSIRPNGCYTNADCTAQPNGVCIGFEGDGNTIRYATCVYEECFSHDDCASDEACACSGRGHRICVSASCRTDADCASGHQCSRTRFCGSEAAVGDFLCTSGADQCLTHADCLNARLGSWCESAGDRRICTSHTCSD